MSVFFSLYSPSVRVLLFPKTYECLWTTGVKVVHAENNKENNTVIIFKIFFSPSTDSQGYFKFQLALVDITPAVSINPIECSESIQ